MGKIHFSIEEIGKCIETEIEIYSADKQKKITIPVDIDTGAGITFIPTQALIDLGYDFSISRPIDADTIGRTEKALVLTVSQIKALGKSVESIPITCLDPRHNKLENSPKKGLLGIDFLSRFNNFNISFSKKPNPFFAKGTVTLK